MPDTDVNELERLRQTNRDLAACLALPALWSSREPSYILTTLLDMLDSMLQLDLVHAAILDANGHVVLEECRPRSMASSAWIQTVERWPADDDTIGLPAELPELGHVRLARVRFRFQSGEVRLRAASPRDDFPTEREMVLLRAALNQAGIALNTTYAEQTLLARERAARREAEEAFSKLQQLEAVMHAARVGAETSGQQLRFALEAGRMGTWEWRIGSGELKWSPGLEGIHGFAPGTFPGTFEAFRNEIHPDDRDRVLTEVTEAVEGRRQHYVELPIPVAAPISVETREIRTQAAGAADVVHAFPHVEVLIVDDDDDARDWLGFMLESRGAVVRTASSTSEALEVYRPSQTGCVACRHSYAGRGWLHADSKVTRARTRTAGATSSCDCVHRVRERDGPRASDRCWLRSTHCEADRSDGTGTHGRRSV
jgi:CheY-like chemotaxis protein